MASSTIQRTSLADEDVAAGGHGASPGDGTEPKLSGEGSDLLDIQRIGLAGEGIAPGSSGNGVSPDNEVERRFSTLSPDVAERAVWIAEQLRSSLEPNVVLERSQEVLNLIYERYKLLCQHIKLFIPPEIEQDFFKVVVDELVSSPPACVPSSTPGSRSTVLVCRPGCS